jgi:hypothetical protein
MYLVLPALAVASPITYLVTVDTASISGTAGFLDFDFAPGNDSQNAMVTIADFSSDGSLTGAPQVNGGASGILPGNVTIDNSTQFNDYFQGFSFGTTIQFRLSFAGPALSSPNGTSTSGSTLVFGMFDSTGSNPLLTSDPDGNALIVDVSLDGTTTVTTFASNAQGGTPAVTLQPVVPVPEPGTGIVLVFCLAGIAARAQHVKPCDSRKPR